MILAAAKKATPMAARTNDEGSGTAYPLNPKAKSPDRVVQGAASLFRFQRVAFPEELSHSQTPEGAATWLLFTIER